MKNLKMALTITAVLLLGFGVATTTSSCEALDKLTDAGPGGEGEGEDGGGEGEGEGDGGGTCTPECAGAACGDADGCGGKCSGTCDEGKVCNATKQCVVEGCEPACDGAACGADDGCEGKCIGTCPEGDVCSAATFECETPDPCETCVATNCPAEFDQCANKNVECALIYLCVGGCEDDDCVTQCYLDHEDGQADYDAVLACAEDNCAEDCGLECVPDCTDLFCGDDDGCGGFCYDCADANKACNPNTLTCEDLGTCGDVTFQGCCDGTTVKYCESGAVQTIDCSGNTAPDNVCGWKDETELGAIYDCGGVGADPTGVNPITCP